VFVGFCVCESETERFGVCVCVCVCVEIRIARVYTYIHTNIHTHVNTYIHTHIYIYMCVYIYALHHESPNMSHVTLYIYTCIHTYTQTNLHGYIQIYTCVYRYLFHTCMTRHANGRHGTQAQVLRRAAWQRQGHGDVRIVGYGQDDCLGMSRTRKEWPHMGGSGVSLSLTSRVSLSWTLGRAVSLSLT